MKTQKQIFLLLFCIITFRLAAQQYNFEFVENKGQWNSEVKFMGDVNGGSFFLQKKGFTVLLNSQADLKKLHQLSHGGNAAVNNGGNGGGGVYANNRNDKPSASGNPGQPGNEPFFLHAHAYKVNFEGASDDVQIIPEKVQESYNNYFIGNDPSNWVSGCKIYKGITYRNMYPGIDVRYYSENGTLKYDIVVNPGANTANIVMKYAGADKLT
ncbi:MAG: hypothetical protein ABJC98_21825, partial [Bacteroidota bacterium]